MAENISSNTEDLYPDNNSKMQIEADAFLNAIAGGADEDQADEAAFFAANPNGVVVDENGEVTANGNGDIDINKTFTFVGVCSKGTQSINISGWLPLPLASREIYYEIIGASFNNLSIVLLGYRRTGRDT